MDYFQGIVERIKKHPQYDELFDKSTDLDEKSIIFNEVLKASPEIVIEIGTANGFTTFFIAEALKKSSGGKVISIDPESADRAKSFISEQGLSEHAEFITMYSNEAFEKYSEEWKGKVGVVFIDGDHSYEGAESDFVNSLNVLTKDGVILIDDAYELRSSKNQGCGRYFRKLKNIHFVHPNPHTWNRFAIWRGSEYTDGNLYKSPIQLFCSITAIYARKKYLQIKRKFGG